MADPPISSAELVSALQSVNNEMIRMNDMFTEYSTQLERTSGAAGLRTVLLLLESKMAGYASTIEDAYKFASGARETMTGLVGSLQQETSDLRARLETMEEEELAQSEHSNLAPRLRWCEKELENNHSDSSRLAAQLRTSEEEKRRRGVTISDLRLQLDSQVTAAVEKARDATIRASQFESKLSVAEEKVKQANVTISGLRSELAETKQMARVRAPNLELNLREARFEKRTAESQASKAHDVLEALRKQEDAKSAKTKSLAAELVELHRPSHHEDGSINENCHHDLDQTSLYQLDQEEAHNENSSLASDQQNLTTRQDVLDEDDGRTHQKRRRAVDDRDRLQQRKRSRVQGDRWSNSDDLDACIEEGTWILRGRISGHEEDVPEQSPDFGNEEEGFVEEGPLLGTDMDVQDQQDTESIREEDVADVASEEDATAADAMEEKAPGRRTSLSSSVDHEDEENGEPSTEDKVEHILSMFVFGWRDYTKKEVQSVKAGFADIFKDGRAVKNVIEGIDRHAFGPLTKRPPYPRACLWGDLGRRSSGEGGRRHSQRSCPACKSRSDLLCCWGKFLPNVGQGLGPRGGNGRVGAKDFAYDNDSQPRTLSVNGHELRWVLKKRKPLQIDPDEEKLDIGGTVV